MKKTYGGIFSPKFTSGSRDPRSQIQGQSEGQKVMKTYHVKCMKIMADLDSLCNSLSKNTNFSHFDPGVTDLWLFESWRSRSFWPKSAKKRAPYRENRNSDEFFVLKFEIVDLKLPYKPNLSKFEEGRVKNATFFGWFDMEWHRWISQLKAP